MLCRKECRAPYLPRLAILDGRNRSAFYRNSLRLRFQIRLQIHRLMITQGCSHRAVCHAAAQRRRMRRLRCLPLAAIGEGEVTTVSCDTKSRENTTDATILLWD